ncbi:Sucrose transport protein [Glycine max]|nr:Sucrose transport protein [Glycine max]
METPSTAAPPASPPAPSLSSSLSATPLTSMFGDSLAKKTHPRAIAIFVVIFWILDITNNRLQGPYRTASVTTTKRETPTWWMTAAHGGRKLPHCGRD